MHETPLKHGNYYQQVSILLYLVNTQCSSNRGQKMCLFVKSVCSQI